MTKPQKRKSKQGPAARGYASTTTSTTPTSSSTTSNTKQTSLTTPIAFTQPSSTLAPFLTHLSPNHIYLLHIDSNPKEIKLEFLILPLFQNLLIAALTLYRIYAGLFFYPDLIIALLGQPSPAHIDTKSASWPYLLTVIGWRAVIFLFDYVLLVVFAPWPIRFFSGPVRWRRAVGFKGAEIVVRRSREWSAELEGSGWMRSDKGVVGEKVVPAIVPDRLEKTGYLLIDADWDLDFNAMVRGHRLVEEGRVGMGEFQTAVLAYGGEEGSEGWLIWRVEDDRIRAGAGGGPGGGGTLSTASRDRIVAFKDKLTEMGKEDLFYRWVEIIQYESTRPGGFTPERQTAAMQEVRELFEGQNVDFEKFWKEVGGMEGVAV